jgi:hypothetical protein
VFASSFYKGLNPIMALGKNIKRHRQARGLTLEQLSDMSGVDLGTIGALEVRDSTRSKYASALAKAMGLSVEQLELEPNLSPSIYSNNVATVSESPHTKKGDSEVIVRFPQARQIDRSDYYTISQYAQGGSMGHGIVIHDQPGVIDRWSASREWFEKNVRSNTGVANLCIVTGFGDSMRPEFNPGDPLIVDTGIKSVVADGIYFFRVGDECYIKQLQKIPTSEGTVYLARSANTDYKDFEISPGMDFAVLGRVLRVWCGTDF